MILEFSWVSMPKLVTLLENPSGAVTITHENSKIISKTKTGANNSQQQELSHLDSNPINFAIDFKSSNITPMAKCDENILRITEEDLPNPDADPQLQQQFKSFMMDKSHRMDNPMEVINDSIKKEKQSTITSFQMNNKYTEVLPGREVTSNSKQSLVNGQASSHMETEKPDLMDLMHQIQIQRRERQH